MSFTPGPYRDGKTPDSIVSDHPLSIPVRDDTREYYGGYVIAESVLPENKPLLKAAPDMYEALENLLVFQDGEGLPRELWTEEYRHAVENAEAALAKARGEVAT